MNLSPAEQIRACDYVIQAEGTTDRARAAAQRLKQKARTEQLKAECAPLLKLSANTERHV